MKKNLYNWIFTNVLGWQLRGKIAPEIQKCVVIVMPHTSWHDFFIGLLVRGILNIEINFVAKKELFRFPFGYYFRYMGGAPLDRQHRKNTVEAITAIFKQRNIFRLAIAPEGTRKKVYSLKSGFYFIALNADVPIIPVAFDYGASLVSIGTPFEPTGDFDSDLKELCKFYAGATGKIARNGYNC